MSDNRTSDELDERRRPEVEDPTGRLGAYLRRTRTPLDLLALLTLWIVVVPYNDFGSKDHISTIALIVRIGVSVIYGIDMAIRAYLAKRHFFYLLTHPVGVLSIPFPPVRLIFSLRLLRSVFRRGNLGRFMLAASALVINGAIIVDLFERHAPGSNIHTFGESLWWSVATVTTVGYGDFVPVTRAGRVTAVFIMAIGILTLAVVTAQVSSSFVEQAARRRQEDSAAHPVTTDIMLAELDRRLARIEELLTASARSIETGSIETGSIETGSITNGDEVSDA
jgi:voltage-gated potassium channel